jgi:predicted RNase H-like nuclease (RuvC/YqgF family)
MRLVAGIVLLGGIVGTTAYSGQPGPEKVADPTFARQAEKFPGVSRHRTGNLADPDKEALRVDNKLLQEEVEDEKAKLEALQKKLERLKKSGISLPKEDEETVELKRENRRLVTELRRLQAEVRLAQEDVQPYIQALEQRAGGRNFNNRRNSYETKK